MVAMEMEPTKIRHLGSPQISEKRAPRVLLHDPNLYNMSPKSYHPKETKVGRFTIAQLSDEAKKIIEDEDSKLPRVVVVYNPKNQMMESVLVLPNGKTKKFSDDEDITAKSTPFLKRTLLKSFFGPCVGRS